MTEKKRVSKKNVAIFISGRGSNMEALIDACGKDANLPAHICLVLSDNPDAKGLDHAREKSIPVLCLSRRAYPSRHAFEEAIQNVLVDHFIDIICLAGFMRILSPDFVARWEQRILNIHPSLLPAFPGLNTHVRALEEGVKIHGCTVHFVTKDLDSGPIIMQAAVPVFDSDDEQSLGTRVLSMEHKIYPIALRRVAGEEICFVDKRTFLHPKLEGKTINTDSSLFFSDS